MYTTAIAQTPDSDEYETCPATLDSMLALVDRDKDVVWEPFAAPGNRSAAHMRRRGFTVCTDTGNFFDHTTPPRGVTVVVSNPPFTLKVDVLKHLLNTLRVPFILVLPSSMLHTLYFHDMFRSVRVPWQVGIPRGRVMFHNAGKPLAQPPFNSMLFCAGRRFLRTRLTLIDDPPQHDSDADDST